MSDVSESTIDVDSPSWRCSSLESLDFGVVNADDLFPPLPDPPLYAASNASTEAAQRDAGSPVEGK